MVLSVKWSAIAVILFLLVSEMCCRSLSRYFYSRLCIVSSILDIGWRRKWNLNNMIMVCDFVLWIEIFILGSRNLHAKHFGLDIWGFYPIWRSFMCLSGVFGISGDVLDLTNRCLNDGLVFCMSCIVLGSFFKIFVFFSIVFWWS